MKGKKFKCQECGKTFTEHESSNTWCLGCTIDMMIPMHEYISDDYIRRIDEKMAIYNKRIRREKIVNMLVILFVGLGFVAGIAGLMGLFK